MDSIEDYFRSIKRSYDSGLTPLDDIFDLTLLCLEKLSNIPKTSYSHSTKIYFSFTSGTTISRPVLDGLFISNTTDFELGWKSLIQSLKTNNTNAAHSTQLNTIIYTAILSFASCYDIWKPRSRKTPGTYFEVLLGSIMSKLLPNHIRSKFITLPQQNEKLSTDIVFERGGTGIVIPAKITTRERIVQPYAHQRILDSIFGEGRYRSVLICVSETQRDDDDTAVNEICVPGTIKLFQEHLAKLSGIFYLDPPTRYLAPDISTIIDVGSLGDFLSIHLKNYD